MLPTRLHPRTASTRGGFTLVELLVVIGIIAILAGVALGPITNGIKKAKQSAALQTAHAIGISMYSAANDNSQIYPHVAGTSALAYAKNLVAGGYISDATIFFVGAANGSGESAYAGTQATAITNLAVTNVNWDFNDAADATTGIGQLSSTSYQFLPILWTAVQNGTAPTITAAATKAVTSVPGTHAPFGTDGQAVFYMNNAAKFITSDNITTPGTPTVVIVPGATNDGTAAGLNYNIHLGGT